MDTENIQQQIGFYLFHHECSYAPQDEDVIYAHVPLESNIVDTYQIFHKEKKDECKTMEAITRDIFQRICMEESKLSFLKMFRTQNFYQKYEEGITCIHLEMKIRGLNGMLYWMELIAKLFLDEKDQLHVFLHGKNFDERKKLELSCDISIKRKELFYTDVGMEAMLTAYFRKHEDYVAKVLLVVYPKIPSHLIKEIEYLSYRMLGSYMVMGRIKDGEQLMFRYHDIDKVKLFSIISAFRQALNEAFHMDIQMEYLEVKEGINIERIRQKLNVQVRSHKDELLQMKPLSRKDEILDELNVWLLLIDVYHHQIIYMNQMMQQQLQLGQDYHQKKCYEILHHHRYPCYNCLLKDTMDGCVHHKTVYVEHMDQLYLMEQKVILWNSRQTFLSVMYPLDNLEAGRVAYEKHTIMRAADIWMQIHEKNRDIKDLLKLLCDCYHGEYAGILLNESGYLYKDACKIEVFGETRKQHAVKQHMSQDLFDEDKKIGCVKLVADDIYEHMEVFRFVSKLCNLYVLQTHTTIKETYLAHQTVYHNIRKLSELYEVMDSMNEDTLLSAGMIGILYPCKTAEEEAFLQQFEMDMVYQLSDDRLLILLLNYSYHEFTQQCVKLRGVLPKTMMMKYYFRNKKINLLEMANQVILLLNTVSKKQQEPLTYQKNLFDVDAALIQQDIQNHAYQIYLQPKADMNNQICGAEALIRYFQDGKMIMPSVFIPELEKTKLIEEIDLFVFEEVCALQKKWEEDHMQIPISFNFSRRTLLDSDLFDKIERIRKRYGVDKQYLDIEITETVGNIDISIINTIMNDLSKLGYPLSLDDFGSNYSNLSILADVNFNTLKLDKGIIDDIYTNEKVRSIISHVIKVCHEMNMKVVAEGVENLDQWNILQELQCDLIQGYYINKPISVAAFEKQYRKQPRRFLRRKREG